MKHPNTEPHSLDMLFLISEVAIRYDGQGFNLGNLYNSGLVGNQIVKVVHSARSLLFATT